MVVSSAREMTEPVGSRLVFLKVSSVTGYNQTEIGAKWGGRPKFDMSKNVVHILKPMR